MDNEVRLKTRNERLAMFNHVDIYPVTCETLSQGRTDLEVLEAAISGGARIIQLREKSLSKKAFYDLAVAFRERCTQAGILFIINDHLDVALSVGADGVHLGQDDFPLMQARKLGPELILGASTHNREEALQAERDGADYYNIGPIYATDTKERLSEFLGPERIPSISEGIRIPFTVMGGIKKHHLKSLLQYGARKVAVVTAVTKAADMAAAVSEMSEILRAGASRTV